MPFGLGLATVNEVRLVLQAPESCKEQRPGEEFTRPACQSLKASLKMILYEGFAGSLFMG